MFRKLGLILFVLMLSLMLAVPAQPGQAGATGYIPVKDTGSSRPGWGKVFRDRREATVEINWLPGSQSSRPLDDQG